MKSLAKLVIFVAVMLLAGCTTKIDKKVSHPENLIHRDTMVNILADMVLMDAIIFFEQRQGKLKTTDLTYFLHNSITEKYKISREQFKENFNYYQLDLPEFDKIMGDVITRLSIMKAKSEQE